MTAKWISDFQLEITAKDERQYSSFRKRAAILSERSVRFKSPQGTRSVPIIESYSEHVALRKLFFSVDQAFIGLFNPSMTAVQVLDILENLQK